MKQYIGTKIINAKPIDRLEYNQLRGWNLPSDENGEDEGYLVEYTDGGRPNVDGFAGYISWSPKEQFDNAYRQTDAMSFGHAIDAAKKGKKIARKGWNGKGMFLIYVPGTQGVNFKPDTPYEKAGIQHANINPHIDLYTAQGDFQPGWLASQADMLADDWEIVE